MRTPTAWFNAACAALAVTGAVPLTAEEGADFVQLEHSIEISAPPGAVWRALTTPEGLRWIAPEVNVEMAIGGDYELYFFPDNPGDRGMEGTHVLAFLPERLLVTEGEIEGSWVVWELEPASAGTLLTVSSTGRGREWAARAPYFDEAMPGVLQRLAAHVSRDPQ